MRFVRFSARPCHRTCAGGADERGAHIPHDTARLIYAAIERELTTAGPEHTAALEDCLRELEDGLELPHERALLALVAGGARR